MHYRDRRQAGLELATHLGDLEGHPHVLVLGIPRGGVVVAHQVALALNAPLDVYMARKLGAPGNPELAIGAISADGRVVVDEALARAVGAGEEYVRRETQRQQREIERRLARYRGRLPPLVVKDRIVVLVDDGVATGATTLAAVQALAAEGPSQLILAVPVASQEAAAKLAAEVDRFVCALIPDLFWAVGAFYADFAQTTDEEVIQLLQDPALSGRDSDGAGGFPNDDRAP
jgi:putative phosphoribosyl transferase